MDLKDNELEWLANHLGHNISVHQEYYRLPENTLQTAKVGKLLLAIESGIGKYKGKQLDEMTELSDIEEEDEEDLGDNGNICSHLLARVILSL